MYTENIRSRSVLKFHMDILYIIEDMPIKRPSQLLQNRDRPRSTQTSYSFLDHREPSSMSSEYTCQILWISDS